MARPRRVLERGSALLVLAAVLCTARALDGGERGGPAGPGRQLAKPPVSIKGPRTKVPNCPRCVMQHVPGALPWSRGAGGWHWGGSGAAGREVLGSCLWGCAVQRTVHSTVLHKQPMSICLWKDRQMSPKEELSCYYALLFAAMVRSNNTTATRGPVLPVIVLSHSEGRVCMA